MLIIQKRLQWAALPVSRRPIRIREWTKESRAHYRWIEAQVWCWKKPIATRTWRCRGSVSQGILGIFWALWKCILCNHYIVKYIVFRIVKDILTNQFRWKRPNKRCLFIIVEYDPQLSSLVVFSTDRICSRPTNHFTMASHLVSISLVRSYDSYSFSFPSLSLGF